MKQYISISRDHSASMRSLSTYAMKDYNSNIESIKTGAQTHNIDTVVSVIECGVNDPGGRGYTGRNVGNKFVVVNSSVASLTPITSYAADGYGTPLFDSIGELVEQLKKVPDTNDPAVSFLIMAITDGEENESKNYTATSISKLIKELQATDRWTFVLRVPKGYSRSLIQLGIPACNIQEWEQTERGFERATRATKTAMHQYYAVRSTGVRASSRFYADLDNVKLRDIQSNLTPITGYSFFPVYADQQIREFIEERLGKTMLIGSAFYQLSKPESVQAHKAICIREKYSGKVYTGDQARSLLGIPKNGEIKLYPGNTGNFDVFIQSTSVNRKLVAGTEVLYWPGA